MAFPQMKYVLVVIYNSDMKIQQEEKKNKRLVSMLDIVIIG